MSWAAHELESIVLHRHLKVRWRVSYLAVLVGALSPDFTKMPAYGLHIGHLDLIEASHPEQYHRGWPGVGPTHSLMFGLVIAVAVFLITRSAPWALGLVIGVWSHVLTDVGDTAGTMLFFPFTTQHYSIGMWRYSAQAGHLGDAASYYSGMGGVWDLFWLLVMVLLGRQALTARYFRDNVETTDPIWAWMTRRFNAPDHVRRVLFRAYVVYGGCRILGWFLWSRLFNPLRGTQRLDVSWGGPEWVVAAPRSSGAATWLGSLVATIIGAAGLAASTWAAWKLARWWSRWRGPSEGRRPGPRPI
jgi:hypothetical protein